MKAFVGFLFLTLFSLNSQAADIKCECPADNKRCSDIMVKLTPSPTGTYLKIDYAKGEKTLEGYPEITTDRSQDRVIYRIGNFILIEKAGDYNFVNLPHQCS